MKKRSILFALLASALSSCSFITVTDANQQNNTQNTQNNTQNTGENNSTNSTTENQNQNQQNNQNTSGENENQNQGSHNQEAQPADVSKWPEAQRKYVTTFLNGKLPYYSAFNSFKTGVVEGSQKPYFNPFVKNTNPVTNYEFEYGDLLRKAGWISEGDETDKDGVLQHYYKYDNLHCNFAKYRSPKDGIYYFDVYAYNDYEAPLALPNSKLSLDVESMKLTGKYQENYSLNVGSYKLTGSYIMKQAYDIQLQKDTGKLIIEGPSKGVAFIITRNADALFVKYGPNKSSLKYAFNNGGTFEFDSQANYIQITAESRVVDFETIDVLN